MRLAPKSEVALRSLRYTGSAAVAVLWTTLLVGTEAAHFDVVGQDPISYLGSEARSAALFTVGLGVSALLLAAFQRHLRDRYPVSAGFSLAMLVGLAAQMVAAFVPIGGASVVHRIHTTSALVLGASLPLLMWRFAAGQAPGPWRRRCYGMFWAEVAACAVGLYLSATGVAAVAEMLPATVFHAWIFVVTFAAVTPASGEVGIGPTGPHPTAHPERWHSIGLGGRRRRRTSTCLSRWRRPGERLPPLNRSGANSLRNRLVPAAVAPSPRSSSTQPNNAESLRAPSRIRSA